MKKGLRFWFFYALPWLAFAASYVAVFIQMGSSLGSAISDALTNAGSAALLGIAVIWLCRRLSWSFYRRPWFFPLHVLLALFYATLWVSTVSLMFTVLSTIERGTLTVVYLRSFALQWEFVSGVMIYATLASIDYIMQMSVRLHEEETRARETALRALRAETLQTQTELSALRAKLNPHFLFNTLHTLMALIRDDRAEAEATIERFSSMLRYILRSQTDTGTQKVSSFHTTFADEWEFVQDYLSLERLRLGDRLRVEAKIDPIAYGALLPPLSLQPLVENAVKHAVASRATGGSISVTAKIGESDLIITVSDDGRGATSNEIEESTGLGLRLIAKTLNTQYQGRAQFSIETSPMHGFTVRLQIPQGVNEPTPVGKALAV